MKRKKKDVQKPSGNIKWMKSENGKEKKQESKQVVDDDCFYEYGLLWRHLPLVIPGFESIDESDPETDLSEEGECLE